MILSNDLLVVGENLNLKLNTDTVPWIDPYRVKTLYAFEQTEIDYNLIQEGELFLKHERSLNKLNFDINDKGELIVIGEDAENYFLDNETGELFYLSSGGIGDMIIEDTFIVS